MSNNKYSLIESDTIELDGIKLYRIVALRDISNIVKEGDLGGYVDNYEALSSEGKCWIYDNAKCYNGSHVLDNGKLKGNSVLKDKSVVRDNALLNGHASVSWECVIEDDVVVTDKARVFNKCFVGGRAFIADDSNVNNNCVVTGDCAIRGMATVEKHSTLEGRIKVQDEAVIESCKLFGNYLIGLNGHVKDNELFNYNSGKYEARDFCFYKNADGEILVSLLNDVIVPIQKFSENIKKCTVSSVNKSELKSVIELAKSRLLGLRFNKEQWVALDETEISPALLEAHRLRQKKGEDYNATVKLSDYFPFGHASYVHMINLKSTRLRSLIDVEKPNFEGLYDTCIDLINYVSFYTEFLNGEAKNDV